MGAIYPGYESLVRVAKKMAEWLPTEITQACEQVPEVRGEYRRSIYGKPIACPEEWLTLGMSPE